MIDLSTTYLGFKLAHPIVPSASPLATTLDGIKRLEDAGAPMVVLASLFEEQIEGEEHILDHYLNYGADTFGEALSYFPDMQRYNTGPESYLNLIRRAKEAVGVPIVASLNGVSPGGWTRYAKLMYEAGADAIELNVFYIPTDLHVTSAAVEQVYIDILKEVRKVVGIPVAVKLNPFFSAMGDMARRLSEGGATALVLFNRFYQPDLDLENLDVVPHLVLSSSEELRLPMRWVAILYKRIKSDLAITSGVHTYTDALKGLMAGANVTMMASELLKHGHGRIREVVRDMLSWMEEHEYVSVKQLQGSMSQVHVANPAAYVRANYMRVLQSWRPEPSAVPPRMK